MMSRLQPFDALIWASTPEQPARLVSRPHGVAHLYVGPLTPAGAVPHNRRPVCNAHTKRLYVDGGGSPRWGTPQLVCARCSARLLNSLPRGRAEQPQSCAFLTRPGDRRRFQGLTVVDIYLSARFAQTIDELDECSLALTLCFTPEEASAEHVSPTGRTFTNLPKWIDTRRYTAGDKARRQALIDLKSSDGKYWDALARKQSLIFQHA